MHRTDMITLIYDTHAILPRTPHTPSNPPPQVRTLTRALSCIHLCSCCNNKEVKTCLKCEEILARSQVVTPCKLQFEGQDMFLGEESPKVQIFFFLFSLCFFFFILLFSLGHLLLNGFSSEQLRVATRTLFQCCAKADAH